MEVLIAVVRLRDHGFTQKNFLTPENFDLLVMEDTLNATNLKGSSSSSPSSSMKKSTRSILSCRPQRGEDTVEAALRHIAQVHKINARRAIPVPLCENIEQPCSQKRIPYSPLVFVPILDDEIKATSIESDLQFYNLAQLVNDSLNYDTSIDGQSRQIIVRIEEWLSQSHCRDIAFINRLFMLKGASSRIRLCTHNPSYNPRLIYFCHKVVDNQETSAVKQRSSELEEAVKKSNTIRARMIEMEKYDRYQINPIFGVGTTYKRRLTAPHYFAKGRKPICMKASGSMEQRSPTEFWEQQFPLHKHAFEGNHDKVLELLNKGYDPNELDNDFWTPLHYCAFYNRFKACEVLMTHPKTNVNAVNKTGATALHFAALNGNAYLVELVLSHQFVDINIKDVYGKTPLDLCERVPKPDWQAAAYLLRKLLRPNKIEVQLIGGPALQVEVNDSFEATAGELRDNVLSKEGLNQAAGRIFAIWITCNRLSLQLKAEQKVKVHMDKWPEHLEKWGDPSCNESVIESFNNDADDQARIVLRRDARTLLGDEQVLARKSPVAISLLYSEAEQNFLAGLYPCNEKFYVQMAAIILQRLYGNHQSIDASVLAHILPRHLLPPSGDARALASLTSKITQAHKNFVKTNLVQLQLIFLKYCWSLNVYGCTFFKAYMLMSKPLRGNIVVHVGVNDWGMSVINATTFKQVAALELKNLDVKYMPTTNFIEVSNRKRDFVATITTPQAMLINNLYKQLKTKVEAARGKSTSH